MGFEPQKFFIGVIDFFSVLLPGALLTYIGKLLFASEIKLDGIEPVTVFLFVSYVLGHFLFLLGSLLDVCFYEPIRDATYQGQIDSLSKGEKLSPCLLQWTAEKVFKSDPDAAVTRATVIKESYLQLIGDKESLRTFQWCKARLALEHPAVLALVNRFEADSKFFRSFIPALLLLPFMLLTFCVITSDGGCTQWALWKWGAAGAFLVGLLLLAPWRYMEQRFKATQQAYWFILTLEANHLAKLPKDVLPQPPGRKPAVTDGVTHAGGVVVRKCGKERKYLLVRSSKNKSERVLPKGHIEAGETERCCAVREVKEETGVWARITGELTVKEYKADNQLVRVRYFLMESLEEETQARESRDSDWFSLEEAIDKATHLESKEVLRLAGEKAETKDSS